MRSKYSLAAALALALALTASAESTMADETAVPPFGLVIHGGAGTITRERLSSVQEAQFRAKLVEAANTGHAVLAQGGEALDAVVAAILVMEDSPLFNAGKGAVFTHDGGHELDASIMDGRDRNAGAVAGVRTVRNPILAARAVMEQSPHVMLAGSGADEFARRIGAEQVENDYFSTPFRRRQLEQLQEREALGENWAPMVVESKFGTVGAVALDKQGNLAAATSTGGTTNKRFGRIGDAPIIGAGTFADNASCAVSATGHGEYFIRNVVAFDVCARVQYRGLSLERAADEVVMETLVAAGGDGGVIAIDRAGNIAMPFNTPGMYRAHRLNGDKAATYIYRDDRLGGK